MLRGVKGKFYYVDEKEIDELEARFGCTFPSELRAFYRQYGRGYLKSKYKNKNKILSPEEIGNCIFSMGEYANHQGARQYIFAKSKLPFFERREESLFSIEINDKDKQKIFSGEVAIADSLEEFIKKYQEDEFYDIMILENKLIASGQLKFDK